MSIDDSYRDILYGGELDRRDYDSETGLTKPCTVGGCGGTMHCKPRLEEAGGPHTLEWPWRPTWVCREHPSHVEMATDADEREAAERHRAKRRR